MQAILQSKVTVLLLTALSVLTAAKQYLGDPIHCIFDARSGVKTEAIDAFCWIHATFPLDPSLIEKLSQLPGHGPPHISRLCSANQSPPPDTSFYQWVHVFLILQVQRKYFYSNTFNHLLWLLALEIIFEGKKPVYLDNDIMYI